MKIGIMGGTFDPIHNGHLMLGEYAYREFKLDQVWFMPNGNPPHKQDNVFQTTREDRMEMVTRSIEKYEYFRLEDYEIKRQEISYSYQTMEYFKEKYPENHFYFIIGADSLFMFEQWVHPERIVATCTILAAYRDDKNNRQVMEDKIAELNRKYNADFRLLVTPVLPMASHELRNRLQQGGSVTGEIPIEAEEYIREHHLYKGVQ
jgi:nicotinate-nucleotide adenylyltransferase